MAIGTEVNGSQEGARMAYQFTKNWSGSFIIDAPAQALDQLALSTDQVQPAAGWRKGRLSSGSSPSGVETHPSDRGGRRNGVAHNPEWLQEAPGCSQVYPVCGERMFSQPLKEVGVRLRLPIHEKNPRRDDRSRAQEAYGLAAAPAFKATRRILEAG